VTGVSPGRRVVTVRAAARRSDVPGVALLFLAVTVLATWPLAAAPFSRLFAPIGPGDPYLNLWILGWDLGTISGDPAALLTGRVFDANIFFPAAGTLAYSDHLVLPALLIWPLWAATGHLVFCYNALLFFSWWGGALSMYLFAREVTGSRAGALLAGLAWGFWPFRPAHLLHLQLQALYCLPLAFLFLHRVVAARRRRDAVLLGLMAALQAIASVYWGVVGAIGLGVAAIVLAVVGGRWRARVARRVALAALVGAVLIAPVVWPYWQAQRREGFARNLYEASQHAATPASYLRVPPGNLVWGTTGLLRPADAAASRSGPEQELFPGLVLTILAVFGAWRGWRTDARPLVAAMVATAAAGFVLSLGPEGVRPLYAMLHRFLFGFDAIRAPARFGVLVALGLAPLAALAIRELQAACGRSVPSRGSLVAASLIALAGVEYLNVPLPSVPAPAASTPAGQWLARAEGPGAVLYLPLDDDAGNTSAMLESLEHRRPIVNGYSGQRPAFFMGLVDVLNRLPSAESLWAARDLGVRFVVAPRPLDGTGSASHLASPLVARARFAGGVVYELNWTPEAEAAVPRPDPPPPPPPGTVPFAGSERAVFQVMWLSGAALGVPAGEATITATRVDGAASSAVPGAAYHLAIELQTAPWVSRFFEARDRLETWVDADLFPLRHEQHLREGRRVVDRATVFDHGARTLRIGDGPPLSLPRGSRDGLAAFLYFRTLPLAPGFAADVPVVEGGRRYTVALDAGRVETIEVQGRRTEALRLAPRMTASGGRQKSLSVTLYTTTDARRVPLLILVDAGFGSFRLELTQYRQR
jgi:hypothetical protein